MSYLITAAEVLAVLALFYGVYRLGKSHGAAGSGSGPIGTRSTSMTEKE